MNVAAITAGGVHEPANRVLPEILEWIRQAADHGADLVLFPELILGHYSDGPVAVDGPEVDAVRPCAHGLPVEVGIGVGEMREDERYSSYLLCRPNGSSCMHRKTRWQTEGCPINLGASAAAHRFGGLKVGVMICSESRVADVARVLAADGAELLIMPHAYGAPTEQHPDAIWKPLHVAIEQVVSARARETHLPAIVVAATGSTFEGGCALLDSSGMILYEVIDAAEKAHWFEIVIGERGVSLQISTRPNGAPEADKPRSRDSLRPKGQQPCHKTKNI